MIRFIYLINIFVFGFIGFMSALNAELANIVLYEKAFTPSPVMQLVASLWLSIAIIAFLGLIYPDKFFSCLILQALFQAIWLLINFVILKNYYLWKINIFFVIWILIFLIEFFRKNFKKN